MQLSGIPIWLGCMWGDLTQLRKQFTLGTIFFKCLKKLPFMSFTTIHVLEGWGSRIETLGGRMDTWGNNEYTGRQNGYTGWQNRYTGQQNGYTGRLADY